MLNMSEPTETRYIGKILWEEYMAPKNISAYKLAKDTHVPTSRIQEILHGRRKISIDTSLRLGKYFGLPDSFFIDMQNDIDIRDAKAELAEDLRTIKTIDKA